MASGTTSSVRVSGGPSRPVVGPAALALLFALGACSPVATYRNLTGASKNDPNPATTPNTKNLAAGEASPYPNLATVPPPPTQELTEAELQNLTQSLVADRKNAKYSDQQLRAGAEEPAAAPSPPAAPPSASPSPNSRSSPTPAKIALGAAPADAAPSKPAPVEKSAIPLIPPVAAGTDAATASQPPAKVATAAPSPGQSNTGSSGAAGTAASASGLPSGMASGLRKPGQPPLPGPMESSLVPPHIPETPQPEQPQPAPPPPRIVAMPTASGGGTARLPAPPAPVPVPPLGAAAYQPPPPRPVLASPAPTRTALAAPAGTKPAPPVPVATPLAKVTFVAGANSLSESDLAALDRVAARYRRDGGRLRVVGYAGVGKGTSDPLNSFRAALDHAQVIAAALAKTGVPSDKIAVEASPARTEADVNQAEVLLEQ
jgi:outer membrane protein OmpA-like peptidoglycan-associated protein